MSILVFCLFFVFAIILRYIVGTTYDERMQTRFKILKINLLLNLLFLSCSKKPVAIHCILLQIFNISFGVINIIYTIPMLRQLEIYCGALFLLVFIPLFIETLVIHFLYGGEWVDSDKRFFADFVSGHFVFKNEEKPTDGYLNVYFNGDCIFYDENKKEHFEGKIKYCRKQIYIYTQKQTFCLEKR